MTSCVSDRLLRALSVIGLAVALGGAVTSASGADEYTFHVSYSASLSGLPVGEGTLQGRYNGTNYRLVSSGEFTGIARLLASYSGRADNRGDLRSGPARFRVNASGDGEDYDVRLRFEDRRAVDISIKPEPEPEELQHPQRVKLTDAHKREIVDPLTAMVAPGGFDGRNFDRSACQRTLPIFTGNERVDLELSFKGVQTVSATRSQHYSGPVMVCSAQYRPVAGHRANNSTVQYLRDRASMEVMLFPAPDSDILLPYRASVTTPLGQAVIQAGNVHTGGRYTTRLAATEAE